MLRINLLLNRLLATLLLCLWRFNLMKCAKFIDRTCWTQSAAAIYVCVCLCGSGLIQLVAIYVSFSYHLAHAVAVVVDTCKTQ